MHIRSTVRMTNKLDLIPTWALIALPLVLLSALLAFIFWSAPAEKIFGVDYPPVEDLKFQRVTLNNGGIIVQVLNDGPDIVTVAQVQVENYTDHSLSVGQRRNSYRSGYYIKWCDI